jgi:hypothetical protein
MTTNKNIIREKAKTYEIEIIKKFKPNNMQKSLINFINKILMKSKYKEHYNFTYGTQKYTLKFILTHIICFLHELDSWRNLGKVWNNVYKHYIRLNNWGIIEKTYRLLLEKYLKRTNNRTLKFTLCDVTIIVNNNGIDCRKRSNYAKNKNCTKLLTIIDKNRIPLAFFFFKGNMNDIKCLNLTLEDLLKQYGHHIVYFLADAGFHSKYIFELLEKYNIKQLIPKNIRNNKKYQKENREKLTYAEKIKIQFEDFSKADRKKYKIRINVENMYANYKNTNNRFRTREDKYIKNLQGLTYLYYSEQIFQNLK